MSEGKVISIFSQKGGVSKTTTSINLATCMALKGKKVLLVDNDPQGNASESFNLQDSEKTIYNVMVDSTPINKAIYNTYIENLSVLPANIEHAQTEVYLMNAMSREMVLYKALRKVMSEYDCIIIDCPPSLGLLSINSLAASSHIIIPIRVGKYALRGLKNLFTTVDKVREHLNESIEITGIVITQDDAQTTISKEIKNELRNSLGEQVLNTTISKATKVVESEFESKPIVLFDKTNKAAKEYQLLTEEVLQRVYEKNS